MRRTYASIEPCGASAPEHFLFLRFKTAAKRASVREFRRNLFMLASVPYLQVCIAFRHRKSLSASEVHAKYIHVLVFTFSEIRVQLHSHSYTMLLSLTFHAVGIGAENLFQWLSSQPFFLRVFCVLG